jgi:SAM-dependent methyltransferase
MLAVQLLMLPKWFTQNPLAQGAKAAMFLKSRHHFATHRGYGPYRNRAIKKALSSPFNPERLPIGYGRWVDERIVEYPWLFSLLPEVEGDLLDAGSTLNHADIIHHSKLHNKRTTILTLAPEENCFWKDGISYIYGDLRKTIFRDETFDYLVSLSVIEHIGLNNQMYDPKGISGNAATADSSRSGHLAAVREMRRVLKSGGTAYFSMPFGKHDVRNWIQVFDAAMVDRVIETFAPTSHTAFYYKSSATSGWQNCRREEAAESRFFDVHQDAPWPGCPAASEAIVCLKMTK